MAFARTIAIGIASAVRHAAACIRARCEASGFVVQEFESGDNLEAAIREQHFAAVVDLALSDLVDDDAGAERLTVAASFGVPQVLVPGGLDSCSPRVLDRVSKEIALKASASRGPTVILIPERGWSDHQDLDAEKLRVLTAGLRLWLPPNVAVAIEPVAVEHPAFAQSVAQALVGITSSPASN